MLFVCVLCVLCVLRVQTNIECEYEMTNSKLVICIIILAVLMAGCISSSSKEEKNNRFMTTYYQEIGDFESIKTIYDTEKNVTCYVYESSNHYGAGMHCFTERELAKQNDVKIGAK